MVDRFKGSQSCELIRGTWEETLTVGTCLDIVWLGGCVSCVTESKDGNDYILC